MQYKLRPFIVTDTNQIKVISNLQQFKSQLNEIYKLKGDEHFVFQKDCKVDNVEYSYIIARSGIHNYYIAETNVPYSELEKLGIGKY